MKPSSRDEIFRLAERYLKEEPSEFYRYEIEALVKADALEELSDRLCGHLQFGTAGLRAPMAGGYRRFNQVSIAKAAWALAQELPSGAKVVVGYDGRHHSQECADETASILAGLDLTVYMFDEAVPTPILAFAVPKLGAQAGAMVTASHNPPQDNGFKVYADCGQQIKPPTDSNIEASMAFAPAYHEMPRAAERHAVPAAVMDDYFRGIKQFALHPVSSSSLTIVYTPLHGVGGKFALRALSEAGFGDVQVVESQFAPDGDFPTVRFPNPEEAGALDEAIATAQRVKADLILANDPDADRLAVVVRDAGGTLRALTGNEIGVLLGADIIENSHLRHGSGGQAGQVVMSTLVSSQMLSKIAAANGVKYVETQTGFSKIANAALSMEADEFLFGYEEALGYCVGTLVRDKDGIHAAVRVTELVNDLKNKGQTVFDRLDELSRRYGLYRSLQWSRRFDGLGALGRMKMWMKTLGEGDVLTFHPGDGIRLIVRPSGTEPKIKFYLEAHESVLPSDDLAIKKACLDEKLAAIRAQYDTAV